MGLNDFFKFGKHNTKQVEDVVEDDPEYVRWLIEAKDFDFADEVYEALERREARRS